MAYFGQTGQNISAYLKLNRPHLAIVYCYNISGNLTWEEHSSKCLRVYGLLGETGQNMSAYLKLNRPRLAIVY